MIEKNKLDGAIWVALNLLLFAAVLTPVMKSGYYNDDILNSLTYEAVHSRFHGSLLEMIWFYTNHWLVGAGRLFPVAFVSTYTTFYYLGWNPFYTELLGVFLILLVGLSAYRFVHRLSGSGAMAFLTLLLLPVTIQTRIGNDPILSYVPLLHISLFFIFEQAIAFHTYCKTEHRYALLRSLALFALALLTYEVSIVAILLNVVILLKYRFKFRKFARLSLVHGSTILFYLGVTLFFRQNATQIYGGVAFGALSAALKSFLINLYASLPFSYWLSDPHKIFVGSILDADKLIISCMLGTLFLILWTQFIQKSIEYRKSDEMGRQNQWILMSGLILIIFPAALMSLSSRYQIEINGFGMAHLPSLMQSFGMAMVIATGCDWAIKRLQNKRWLWGGGLVVGVVLSLAPGLSRMNHQTVIASLDLGFETKSRALFVEALRNGLLETVPEGAVLVFDRIPFWLQPELIPMFSGKHATIQSMADANVNLLESNHDEDAQNVPSKVFFHVRWQKMTGLETCNACGVVSIAQLKVSEISSPEGLKTKQIIESDLVALSKNPTSANVKLHACGIPGGVKDAPRIGLGVMPLRYDGPCKSDPSWHRWRLPGMAFADLQVSTETINNWGMAVFGARPEKNPRVAPLRNSQPNDVAVTPNQARNDTGQGVVGTGRYFEGECSGFHFENIANSWVTINKLALKAPFWVSFWVKPTGAQLPNATLISNHSNYKGFTLEQDSSADRNSYTFSAGNGQAWFGGGGLKIEPNSWSFVILQVDPNRIQAAVYNQGKISRLDFPGTFFLGAEPLHIGNWQGKDRAFNGVIAGIEILQNDIPQQFPADVSENEFCK